MGALSACVKVIFYYECIRGAEWDICNFVNKSEFCLTKVTFVVTKRILFNKSEFCCDKKNFV